MKNKQTTALIRELKRLAIEQQRPLWKRVASDLAKPTRQRRVLNLWRLEQHVTDGETVIVPGKLLGDGILTKKVTVAAASFSDEARRKVRASGGAVLTIEELLQQRPDGKDLKILG